MQIIIVQSEIETAIRDYVMSVVDIKEGMRIDIDLTATRGADGFKASIDIVPEDHPVADYDQVRSEAGEAQVETATSSVGSDPTKPLDIVTKVRKARGPNKSTLAKAAEAEAQTETTQEEEAEVVQEEPAPNSEEALAAEAQVTEPAVEEANQTAEAEVEGLPVADLEAEVPIPAPTRSLFANLNKPTND